MRKKVFGRKLSRGGGARKALFRSLIKALIFRGKIETTKAKAKAIQPDVDKLITLIKKETIASTKRAVAILGNDEETIGILIKKYLPNLKVRTSGFTRIISLPRRKGDLAEIVTMEMVDKPVEVKKHENVPTKRK